MPGNIDSGEFISALDALAKERRINKDVLFAAIESALISAYKKNFGKSANVRAAIDREKGTVEVFARKTVVEVVCRVVVESFHTQQTPLKPTQETPSLSDWLTAAIRAIDPHHIIILSGAQWDQNFAPFGPPFAPNLVYTYHKFWSVMGRDAVHDYIAFSRQHRVPILLGEAGEAANEWNVKFRTLNERFGFGWSFWTYKNLASTSTIASVPMPQGWHKLAALGSMFSPSLEKVGLTREEARRILNAYLEAIRFSNTRLNACYLRSLDKAPWLEEECRADEAKKRALGLKPD